MLCLVSVSCNKLIWLVFWNVYLTCCDRFPAGLETIGVPVSQNCQKGKLTSKFRSSRGWRVLLHSPLFPFSFSLRNLGGQVGMHHLNIDLNLHLGTVSESHQCQILSRIALYFSSVVLIRTIWFHNS